MTTSAIHSVFAAPCYRYFDKPEHADALERGELWVTTVQRCRKQEDLGRRDEGEGTQRYNTGNVLGNPPDPKVQEIATKVGMFLDPNLPWASAIDISNNTRILQLSDAYLFCMTSHRSADATARFGRYCVQIDTPMEFFHSATKAITARFTRVRAHLGRVMYKARAYSGHETAPGPLGFVKPKRFKKEKEVRILWIVDHDPLGS
jgi:hypothetical protein